MKNARLVCCAVGALLATRLTPIAEAQAGKDEPLPMPRFVQKAYQSKVRGLDGKPTSAYWQNKSVHKMIINVAPPNRQVSATEEVTYFNNSPDPQSFIVFRLYLNAHRPEAIREQMRPKEFLTSGIQVDDFQINGTPALWDDPRNPLAPRLNMPGSTVHAIALEKPLPPGGSIRFSVGWHYDIAQASGWKEGLVDDSTYFLAYFYPRVSVYSDTSGWDTLPFSLSREFSNDFCDFSYEVRTPKNFVVWATGDLQNPDEVLQPAYAQKLKQSFQTDEVINIARPEEVRKGQVTSQADTLSWKWKADNVPDIAIAVSNHYVWDAGSALVDPASGRRASVQAAYSSKADDFKPMVEFAKKALVFGSTQYPGVAYPYSKTTVVEAGADEEYPMMANDESLGGKTDANGIPGYGFTGFVAAHELLHSWFPFYMGINEKRYPFMDEGWTTAFEYLYNRETIGSQLADGLFEQMRTHDWMVNPTPGSETPIIMPHDALLGGGVGFAMNGYGKAALGYLALRDLMGDAAFKKSLHAFMERWHGKHPLPWDMFNTFNQTSGTNYNWFFNNWFYQPYYLDIGVQSVRPTRTGQMIEVKNTGGMAMPFDLELTYQDGGKETLHQTPAVWKQNLRLARINLKTSRSIKSVRLNGGIWLDFNPQDNVWENPGQG